VAPEEKAEMVRLMRQVGMDRILYGTDMPLPWNPSPRDWWRKTILTLPLTDDEIRNIADNAPPYLRRLIGARK
jgi:predicted TIM-barrel fold metal-dependent hydrolase